MKSHVSMEKKICPICTRDHETGSILLDRRLRQSLERYTVTGYAICKNDQEKLDAGYIALIGIDPEKSFIPGDTVKMENAYRTGAICHIREKVFAEMFNMEIPESRFLFVDHAVIERLEALFINHQKGEKNELQALRGSNNRTPEEGQEG